MKSILLHIYDDDGLESRLQCAFDLARGFDGQITCLHATPFRHYLDLDPIAAAALPNEFLWRIQQNRDELQVRLENRFRSHGIQWNWIQADEVTSASLVHESSLVDVIVLNLDGPAAETQHRTPISASVAVRARSPVLAVPYTSTGLRLTAPALVAWNGSQEAAAAVRAALPILKVSEKVQVLQVEEKKTQYPQDRVARYLSRHGIKADIIERTPHDGSVSDVIRTVAVEIGAEIIVLGAYGRSRLQEYLFGGVTRELLTDCPVPLLLAH